MRILPKFIILLFVLLVGKSTVANSQVLISLVLGDDINSGKIEFGLEGGFNYSSFYNLDEGKRSRNFNIGFYFLIRMNETSYINTGVLVKQSQGARDLNTYTIGDPQIDSLFANGTLTRKINYFQVPINYHYRTPFGIYFEAGIQAALRNSAKDFFYETIVEEDDASFTINTRDNYTRLDFGFLGGLGYKLKDREGGVPGMSFGGKYYYGLVNASKDDSEEFYNDSYYIFIRIPIGAGKAAAKAQDKQKK